MFSLQHQEEGRNKLRGRGKSKRGKERKEVTAGFKEELSGFRWGQDRRRTKRGPGSNSSTKLREQGSGFSAASTLREARRMVAGTPLCDKLFLQGTSTVQGSLWTSCDSALTAQSQRHKACLLLRHNTELHSWYGLFPPTRGSVLSDCMQDSGPPASSDHLWVVPFSGSTQRYGW